MNALALEEFTAVRRRGRQRVTDPWKNRPVWWAELAEGYLRAVARKGRRPNTVRAYRFELRDFGAWLQRADVAALSDLNRHHLEGWQDDMLPRKAPRTQSVATTAVRELLRWAARQDLPLTPSLWLSLEHRRKPRLLPKPIPLADLRIVLDALDKPEPDLGKLCTRALFWLLYSSGSRISAALSLDRCSIEDRAATVIQKGGSPHRLMISAKAEAAIRDYLDARTDTCRGLFAFHGPGRFWLARLSGYPLPAPTRLGIKGAQRGWNELCRELGIKRFTSHRVRHSCATTMLRNGVDSLVIAKHMGHHDLSTLQGYAEVDEATRLAALEAFDERLANPAPGHDHPQEELTALRAEVIALQRRLLQVLPDAGMTRAELPDRADAVIPKLIASGWRP